MKDTIQHAISADLSAFLSVLGLPIEPAMPAISIFQSYLQILAMEPFYLIANLAGWPILGVMLGPILGEEPLMEKPS